MKMIKKYEKNRNTIFFVDDEVGQREIITLQLNKLNYRVKTASGPKEALKILEEQYFPIIILDLNMPSMDGTQLCARIREKTSAQVIYALSGYYGQYNTKYLKKSGFDGYLCKPVSLNVLQQALEGAFERLKNEQTNGFRVT